MSEQGKPVKSLSEISHLFLSNIRDKQGGAAPRPQRIPPKAAAPAPKAPSVDLTPEEFAQVFSPENHDGESPRIPAIQAVLASHLGARQFDAARRYARGLAVDQRVGLLYVDAGELRLLTFEPGETDDGDASTQPTPFDTRAIRDAINELNWDLDLWLLVVANPKLPEGRALLRAVEGWTALAASDQEGIVTCYRMLKGLSEMQRPVQLVMIDSAAPDAQRGAGRKIADVCRQFLHWHIELGPALQDAPDVAECRVLHCAAPHDKAQPSGAHWQAVQDLLEHARLCAKDEQEAEMPRPNPRPAPAAPAETTEPIAPAAPSLKMDVVQPPRLALHAPVMQEVIDLPLDDDQSIIAAVLQHHMTDLVQCPLRPPMCPEACLAVGRDHRLVLIATAGQGLSELRNVGLAYRWVVENRALLAMAMPQFSLDAGEAPQVRLLVDQADLAADLLQPLLQVETIRIQTYRRVRWGQRTGLLLDAA